MRAIIIRKYGEPDVLQLETVPEPTPSKGQVRISVHRAGVAFGDTLRRRGLAGGGPIPYIPGYDVAGEIDAVGLDVLGWRQGDRVAAFVEFGGYAEKVCASVDALVRIPDGVSDDIAVTLVLNYGTASQMLKRSAGATPGQSIVTTSAAGGVGTALLDIARANGIRAVGLATASKHDLVRRYGANPVDYRRSSVVADVVKALDKQRADVAFDGVGGGNLWRSRAMTKPNGKVVLFGIAGTVANGKSHPLGLAPTIVSIISLAILPGARVVSYVSTEEQKEARRKRYADDVAALMSMAVQGRLDPLIEKVIPLDSVVKAHRALEAGHTVGKTLLAID